MKMLILKKGGVKIRGLQCLHYLAIDEDLSYTLDLKHIMKIGAGTSRIGFRHISQYNHIAASKNDRIGALIIGTAPLIYTKYPLLKGPWGVLVYRFNRGSLSPQVLTEPSARMAAKPRRNPRKAHTSCERPACLEFSV